eukprot:GHUV01027294.1.p1 GENE.GHUV01027294.1~~GHUV01027294.1.p1  ORF type:complete len:120 (-),score=4.99 GHUV01027294.1:560-919(-)
MKRNCDCNKHPKHRTYFVSGIKKIANRVAIMPMPPKKKNTPNFIVQSMVRNVWPTAKVIRWLTKVLMAVPATADEGSNGHFSDILQCIHTLIKHAHYLLYGSTACWWTRFDMVTVICMK